MIGRDLFTLDALRTDRSGSLPMVHVSARIAPTPNAAVGAMAHVGTLTMMTTTTPMAGTG